MGNQFLESNIPEAPGGHRKGHPHAAQQEGD